MRDQFGDRVAALFRTLDDVLSRRRDPVTGRYAEADQLTAGDITGLMRAVLVEVVDPIRAALDDVTGLIGDTIVAVDADRRRRYGPGYQPAWTSWPVQQTRRQGLHGGQ